MAAIVCPPRTAVGVTKTLGSVFVFLHVKKLAGNPFRWSIQRCLRRQTLRLVTCQLSLNQECFSYRRLQILRKMLIGPIHLRRILWHECSTRVSCPAGDTHPSILGNYLDHFLCDASESMGANSEQKHLNIPGPVACSSALIRCPTSSAPICSVHSSRVSCWPSRSSLRSSTASWASASTINGPP
jgi:hypothetical protein